MRAKHDMESKPLLLYVGRLVKEKDLADLIPVSRILRQRGYDFRMVFVGDGPMRDRLSREIPDAHFTGTLEGAALSRWYASADIFLFPSTTETFGLVVQEAFASGIPVVGVRAGGVISLIDHGETGYLAEPNVPEDIADKLAALLDAPGLRRQMGESAREYTLHRSWDEINRRLVQDYKSMISAGPEHDPSQTRTLSQSRV